MLVAQVLTGITERKCPKSRRKTGKSIKLVVFKSQHPAQALIGMHIAHPLSKHFLESTQYIL